MAAGNDQEKTEPASPKRRQDAREKGQVAQSREVSSVLILLSALGVFHFAGSWMLRSLTGTMCGGFERIVLPALQPYAVQNLMIGMAKDALWILIPMLLAVFFMALAANVIQVGFHLTGEPLRPKFSKVNPIKGLQRLFSLRALTELFKSFAKITIVGGMALTVVSVEADGIPSLLQMGVGDILDFIGQVALKIAFYTCLVLILIALADYLYQRWQFEKDLRMSKQEVKEEHKQQEGDPMVRARIRRIQTELARHRMMEAVPDADVVITNPTHFAVALKYTPQKMMAPKLVAKGAGVIAQRIKAVAAQADVPVIENKPLAQSIFRSVEIDAYIPAELYRAVAEILAYVYNLKRSR